jgi:putative addiction module component (TIGR02574 family)
MSEAVMNLLPQVQALSDDERDELRGHLDGMESTEDLSQKDWEDEWVDEINRRIADVEAGRVPLLDGEEVMARLRAKHGIKR